jgi:predicted transcriptional regulator
MKRGPVNAATVLPAELLPALQAMAAGRQVYIPARLSPVAARWEEARRLWTAGRSVEVIGHLLGITPRAVARLLAAPQPPRTRAAKRRFDTPERRALLREVQQYVQARVLYVPTAMSQVARRRRRMHRLFAQGWTADRVAAHLKMTPRYIGQLYEAWRRDREAEGRRVVPGQPLISLEERMREHEAAVRRKDLRAAAKRQRREDAEFHRVFGADAIRAPRVKPVIFEWPT